MRCYRMFNINISTLQWFEDTNKCQSSLMSIEGLGDVEKPLQTIVFSKTNIW